MPGKYYTLEEARELVDFCKQHQVMLIPEIDMPGHSAAFIRTFRHDMQSPEGMKILKLLIDEVCETFDVPYLHIGTDEVAFTNPDFVPEMVSYVRSKGKKVILGIPVGIIAGRNRYDSLVELSWKGSTGNSCH